MNFNEQDCGMCPKCHKMTLKLFKNNANYWKCSNCHFVLNSKTIDVCVPIKPEELKTWIKMQNVADILNYINDSKTLYQWICFISICKKFDKNILNTHYDARSNISLTDFTVNNEKYEAVRIMNKDQSCSNDLENYLFERLKNKINKLRTHKSKVHLVCFDYVENIFSDISPRWVNNFETISKKTQ